MTIFQRNLTSALERLKSASEDSEHQGSPGSYKLPRVKSSMLLVQHMQPTHNVSAVSLEHALLQRSRSNVRVPSSVENMAPTSNASSINQFYTAQSFNPRVDERGASDRNELRPSPSWPPLHADLKWSKWAMRATHAEPVDPDHRLDEAPADGHDQQQQPAHIFREVHGQPYSSLDVTREAAPASSPGAAADPVDEGTAERRARAFALLNEPAVKRNLHKILPQQRGVAKQLRQRLRDQQSGGGGVGGGGGGG